MSTKPGLSTRPAASSAWAAGRWPVRLTHRRDAATSAAGRVPRIRRRRRRCRPRRQGREARARHPSPKRANGSRQKEIKDISGLTHGVGWCAPQQGACKLTLNIKDGVIEEALVETIGCSGMTHSAAMAAEILIGKTILEALNTDLVCDAINTAMRELFLQIVYGRSQTAFSEDGLPSAPASRISARACAARSAPCTAPSSKGPRYLEMAEGYVTRESPGQGRRDHRLRVRQPGQDDGRIKKGRIPRRR
jgi:NifU-like protein involved in Fe-S cluster formation